MRFTLAWIFDSTVAMPRLLTVTAGKPVLNPWRGRSAEREDGFGPGGAPSTGNWGTGASFSYGDEQLTQLIPGSSGSSGRYFQGSGAGGGAIELRAGGDLTIAPGVLLSANGGNGRTDGYQSQHGGGWIRRRHSPSGQKHLQQGIDSGDWGQSFRRWRTSCLGFHSNNRSWSDFRRFRFHCRGSTSHRVGSDTQCI